MLDMHTREHGYTEYYVPYIVNAETLTGTSQLPKFEDDMFWVTKGGAPDDERMYLIPTAEVPLTNFVRDRNRCRRDQVAAQTDRAYAELSFRGGELWQGHARHDSRASVRQGRDGADRASGQIVRRAGGNDGPRRRHPASARAAVSRDALCTGDMGFAAAKTYDLEVWLPGQDKYREISSCSNCEAFQARRMQARFRNAQGKPELCTR